MTGLDLTAVEKALDGWLVDDLEIHRDNGVSDDEIDPETLLLIPTEGELVWEGKGAIQPLDRFADLGDPDVIRVMDETGAKFRALVSLRVVTGSRIGDVLTCKAIHGISTDPRLAGESFSIREFGGASSFAVTQFIYLRPIEPAA